MKKTREPLLAPFRNRVEITFRDFLNNTNSNNPIIKELLNEDWKSDISFIGFDMQDDKQLTFIDTGRIVKLVKETGQGTSAFVTKLESLDKQSARASRIVSRLLPNKTFKQADIEDFTNLIIAQKGGRGSFVLYSRYSDILWGYHESNYLNTKGTLGDSCMKYDRCQDWLDIYASSDKVRLLVLKAPGSGKIAGRAVVWDDARIYETEEAYEDGCSPIYTGVFMDRIYISHDADKNKFRDYARAEGWAFRTSTAAHDRFQFTTPNHGTTEDNAYIEANIGMDVGDFEHYPYMDTLVYARENGHWLNNHRGRYEFQSTGGGYSYDGDYYNDESEEDDY